MIKKRELVGVAAVSAFFGAVVGLFLFGSLGGSVNPGPAVQAGPPLARTAAEVAAADLSDPGQPITTTTFTNVAGKVVPSVVVITSEKTIHQTSALPFGNDPFMRRFFGNALPDAPQDQEVRGLGSGVIVSPDGYILTNNHVVNEADRVVVRMGRHTQLDAQVVGTDPKSDLAVLKVDAKDLPAISFGDSDQLKVGEWVVTVGAPYGLESSVTAGIVSAMGRSNVHVADYEDFIQTDAAINHGNSGGALVNLRGELVGINTAIATNNGSSSGVGFAIPVNMARRIMDSLIHEGKVSRGWIGVQIQDNSQQLAKGLGLSTDTGVAVSDVQDNSPARKAGLKVNDVIVSLNGEPIDDTSSLRNKVAATQPGTDVNLGIVRGKENKTIVVRLEELPPDLTQDQGDDQTSPDSGQSQGNEGQLGFQADNLNPDLAQQFSIKDNMTGVVVTGVDPTGPAADGGLRAGDLILEVNGRTVSNLDQFRSALGHPKQGDSVVLRVARGSSYFFVPIEP